MTGRDRRHAIVLAHIASENAHDFDATVQTFATPLYEVEDDSWREDAAVDIPF